MFDYIWWDWLGVVDISQVWLDFIRYGWIVSACLKLISFVL